MKVWGHGLGRFEFMNDEECTFSFKLGKVCVTVWEGLYYGSNETCCFFYACDTAWGGLYHGSNQNVIHDI